MQKISPFVYKLIVLLALCAMLLAGCAGEEEEARVELADPIGGSSIVTGADLLAFLERGESNTATLSGTSAWNRRCCVSPRSGMA